MREMRNPIMDVRIRLTPARQAGEGESFAVPLKLRVPGLALIFRPLPAASWPNACATFAPAGKRTALASRTRLRRPRYFGRGDWKEAGLSRLHNNG